MVFSDYVCNKYSVGNLKGKLGELLAEMYLRKYLGYMTIEKNYTTRWGEIDLIMCKLDIVRFIEVKFIGCRNYQDFHKIISRKKEISLQRSINRYLFEKKLNHVSYNLEYVFVKYLSNKRVRIYHYDSG